MTDKSKANENIGTLLILFSTILFFWLLWPYPQITKEISFQPGELTFTSIDNADTLSEKTESVYAIQEEIQIIVEWKSVVRKGGLDTIKLQVIQNDQILEGSESDDSNTSLADAEISNIFNNNSIMARSRLDLADVTMDPIGESGVVLPEGEDISFSWEISPEKVDRLQGTVWLFLDAFPDDGSELISKPVSAQRLDVNVISILGIDVGYLWIIALISTIFGALFYLDIIHLRFRKCPSGGRKSEQKR